MRMGRRGDRDYSSEQALNKLLSIQCAFLEQRDETLNGVLHTLPLLGRGHAAMFEPFGMASPPFRRRFRFPGPARDGAQATAPHGRFDTSRGHDRSFRSALS